MNNEEKIISMLDRITGEIQSFKQETNSRFDSIEQDMVTKTEFHKNLDSIKQDMVTKTEFHKTTKDAQDDIKAMLTIITNNLLEQDTKFSVVNDHLFKHDIEIRQIKEDIARVKEA